MSAIMQLPARSWASAHRVLLTVLAIALALALVPATASFAVEPTPVTGCPPSDQILVVAELTAAGYVNPAILDSEGNGNGLVCGKPFNPVAQENLCPAVSCHVPVLYLFREDDLTRK